MPSKGLSSSIACLLLLASGLPGNAMGIDSPNLMLKKGTPVELRLEQNISSLNAHRGQHVNFVVVHNVDIDGFTVIRSGTAAAGSVLHVRKNHPLGIAGNVTIQLDSVELANGNSIELTAHRKFKGRSRTLRMGIKMALVSAIYWPLAPILLLSHGKVRTVLAGTEVTAYTSNNISIQTTNLSSSKANVMTLEQIIHTLPARVTNREGKPGDALNLVFWATRADLQAAFKRAGWIIADKPTPRMIWPLIWQRWHYRKFPMFNLYVYGRPQDFAYTLPDPRLIVERRHHVRIWKTDYSLDGIPVWVGSATHDISIKVVLRKLLIFHRINPNVDAERNFIARDLAKTWHPVREDLVPSARPVYTAKTTTGQTYHTDGRILFVDLNPNKTLLAAGLRPQD